MRWEIFHESIDKLSNTEFLLEEALRFIYDWSRYNRPHFPLTIFFDIKGQYHCHPFTCLCFGRLKDESLSAGFSVLQALIHQIWDGENIVLPYQIGEPICELEGKSLFLLHKSAKYMRDSDFFLLMGSIDDQCCELGDDMIVLKARGNGTLVRSLSSKFANFIAVDEYPGEPSISLAHADYMSI